MNHWLSPLLSPKSIAIVGASQRNASLATTTYVQLRDREYPGEIYLVNPRYDTLFERPCYPNLATLPAVPDMVLYAISGRALEKSFDEALALKVGGVVMYASNHLGEDSDPPLPERLKTKAAAANIPVLGGNSMGFYNYDDKVFVSFDHPPCDRPPGHISLIAQSGSAMTYLANNDARFCFNYVIASGQETNASVGVYMDYLLDQASTRVIALFLETVRDVECFVSALKKAQQRDIPVVILKLGRTEKSAELAVSHSGAIAGNHDAFVAVCETHNAIIAKDTDELMITALLFSLGLRVGTGGIASALDSGGMRELMVDLADDYNLYFAEIEASTKAAMSKYLEAGLAAENPLDAMGALGRNTEKIYLECGKALLNDPETALLTFEFEFRDGFSHYPELFSVIDQLNEHNDKPLIVINSHNYTCVSETAAELCNKNIPMINGIDVALRAIKNVFQYCNRGEPNPPREHENLTNKSEIFKWREKLCDASECDEHMSLQFMQALKLPVISHAIGICFEDIKSAADKFGYPVVLKTAAPGIFHKSDCSGVKLSIQNERHLQIAYADISSRLGNRVLIAPMLEKGVEVAVGMKNDVQYGPLIILSAGGIFVELLDDRAMQLAPISADSAREMIRQLKISKLMCGARNQAPHDIEGLAQLISEFSDIVFQLSDVIAEIDLNPILVTQSDCTIVDALVIPK